MSAVRRTLQGLWRGLPLGLRTRIRSHPRLAGLARRIAPQPTPAIEGASPPAAGTADAVPQIEIFEATLIQGRRSTVSRPRVNLLLPTLKPEHVFGGILTALQFYLELIGDDVDARIILTDQGEPPETLPALLAGWRMADADDADEGAAQGEGADGAGGGTGRGLPGGAGRLIVPFAERGFRTLAVREHDVFVATAWWTAYVAQRVLPWQAQAYGREMRPFIYLVQDHEPGFYPWSTRYTLAQSTYEFEGPMLGVFNTGLLRDYFSAQGYRFTRTWAFEPRLNATLAAWHARQDAFDKRRRLIVYGRPGVPRNAFELVCQGVRHWSAIDPGAAHWEISSLGEAHGPVGLHQGNQIRSCGKLSLEQYAQTLAESALGVSLMYSPHPSYPPLEMAEFGIRTVTNTFANKDLSQRSADLISLRSATPEAIGETLKRLAAPWREQAVVRVGKPAVSLFSGSDQTYPFADEVRLAAGLQARR